VPQFLPIVFELALRKLGAGRFIDALRTKLYERARFPIHDPDFRRSAESLAVLARLVVQEFERGGRRRVEAVVTLNADDLLEQAVAVAQGRPSRRWVGRIVRSYARTTGRHVGLTGPGPIPIYHLHGFVPANIQGLYGRWPWRFPRIFDHNLVFTDAQYWSTSASALTFANRVMSWMLSETRCLFIGLSMTDVNLLRWMALRTIELVRDTEEAERFAKRGESIWLKTHSARHGWVRPKSDDPVGFLSEFLALRGVEALEIEAWSGEHFARFIKRCFPVSPRRPAHRRLT